MKPQMLIFPTLLFGACMKPGVPLISDNVISGSWVLESQEHLDSTGRSGGRMDFSTAKCPEYLVITADSVRTLATRSPTVAEAKTHSSCYIQDSQAYAPTRKNEFALVGNPFVRVFSQRGGLRMERKVVTIGLGNRTEVLSYRKLEGVTEPDLAPCKCD